MFASERSQLLEDSRWEPWDEHLGYIECWSTPGADGDRTVTSENYRRGYLTDSDVDDWLHQRGSFAAPERYSSNTKGSWTNCLRLLMCERVDWHPPSFAMSQRSFLAVEKAFGLPRATLPIISRDSGMEFYKLGFGHSEDGRQVLHTVSTIIKLPQMFQLGNCGLVMTHSFITGNTYAFLHGWSVFGDRNVVSGEWAISHSERFHQLLTSSTSLWRHPLLLPTLLLQEHLFRASEFSWRALSRDVTSVEKDLAVTKSGRLVTTKHAVPEEIKNLLTNDDLRLRITTRVNTALTDAINFTTVLKWDQRLGQFIQRVDKELQRNCDEGNLPLGLAKDLESAVDHLLCEAISATEYIDSVKSRLEVQLSVLYNLVAQAGNDLNFKIAAAAGLDSAAMKTLAFVTTVFLPPAFIASLFSMSMFDWQASSDDDTSGHRVVAKDFWIYWVISIPLTALILVGWRFWWKTQRTHYSMKYLRMPLESKPGENLAAREKR